MIQYFIQKVFSRSSLKFSLFNKFYFFQTLLNIFENGFFRISIIFNLNKPQTLDQLHKEIKLVFRYVENYFFHVTRIEVINFVHNPLLNSLWLV